MGVAFPAVKVQVKATSNPITDPDSGDLLFDLDTDAYDFLRMTNHAVARVLVVINLCDEVEWVDVQRDQTRPLGREPSLSLCDPQQAHDPYPDASVDRAGLGQMLRETGTRRSTPIPDEQRWP